MYVCVYICVYNCFCVLYASLVFLCMCVYCSCQVVSTQIEVSSKYTGKDAILAYQMVESSQLMMVS